ncbi:MAG: hypothetical protein QGF53_03335 [Alphaproteobacteria bacterium]|nr:hypothetical protein [Alphaproteobacteria bacterium]
MSDEQDWAKALSEQAMAGAEDAPAVRETIEAILAATPETAPVQLETARAAFAVALEQLRRQAG